LRGKYSHTQSPHTSGPQPLDNVVEETEEDVVVPEVVVVVLEIVVVVVSDVVVVVISVVVVVLDVVVVVIAVVVVVVLEEHGKPQSCSQQQGLRELASSR
jgi:ABC-type multidrug transport system fused ATPase/permease subunit